MTVGIGIDTVFCSLHQKENGEVIGGGNEQARGG